MPLGISEGNPMAIAAMGERYGDRLVSQLSQAGGMIENGLKAVTTMKELQSLGQTLSQISPESPDYQQQLMQLGAAHPFAMQDPRGQALISMGNQQHLQWKNQQFAMQQADRQEARADRRDAMSDRRQGMRDANAYRIAQLRYGTGGDELNPLTKVTPQPGFSNSVGLSIDQTQEAADENATNLPVDLRMPGDDMSDLQIPASLTRRGISMEDWQDTASRIPSVADPEAQVERTAPRDLTKAEMLNNELADIEELQGFAPTRKSRTAQTTRLISQQGINERAGNRNEGINDRFDRSLAAKDEALEFKKLQFKERQAYKERTDAVKQAAAKLKADGTLTTVQDRKLKSLQEEMDNAIKTADEVEIGAAGDAAIDEKTLAELPVADRVAIARRRAMAPKARADADVAIKAFEQYTKENGGSAEKGWKISPNNPNWEINDETKQVRPKK